MTRGEGKSAAESNAEARELLEIASIRFGREGKLIGSKGQLRKTMRQQMKEQGESSLVLLEPFAEE